MLVIFRPVPSERRKILQSSLKMEPFSNPKLANTSNYLVSHNQSLGRLVPFEPRIFCTSCSKQKHFVPKVTQNGPNQLQNRPVPRYSTMIPPSKHLAIWPYLFPKYSYCMQQAVAKDCSCTWDLGSIVALLAPKLVPLLLLLDPGYFGSRI